MGRSRIPRQSGRLNASMRYCVCLGFGIAVLVYGFRERKLEPYVTVDAELAPGAQTITTVGSDEEDRIVRLRLSTRNKISSEAVEGSAQCLGDEMLVCVPTVSRPRDVEYVSRTVKSWFIAARTATFLRRIHVFDMNVDQTSRDEHRRRWLTRVFEDAAEAGLLDDQTRTPPWLVLEERSTDTIAEPVRQTHGDAPDRIAWRSKEVLDYAEVLERCADAAAGEFFMIVQDDILFTNQVQHVLQWSSDLFRSADDSDGGSSRKQNKHRKWCGASLFDFGSHDGVDIPAQRNSNMVARVYRKAAVRERRQVLAYLRANFDVSPVDWLFDEFCRRRGRRVAVMFPYPVRHRGEVSSFVANTRAQT